MKLARLGALAVLWCLAAHLAAQTIPQPTASLRVTVRAQHGTPVAGATVIFNNSSYRTDASGVAIAAVALGTVEIRVTQEGFLPGTTSLRVDEAREWQITLELQPVPVVEESITVHATRTEAGLQDSPTRVEVMATEEIEEKIMMTPGDIVMLLNEMGGMRVQSTSPSLGASSVRIQGMRGRYTRFLSDGLPLFGQQGGGLGLLQIPPTDLAQVEVIKGAASAMYGAGAMAGVVNLVSRQPEKEPIRDFVLNRSTRGATDVSAFLASELTAAWGASLLVNGDWQQTRDLDVDGWSDLPHYSRGVARPRFFWKGAGGQTAFLTAGITYENRQGGTVSGAVLGATGNPYVEALNTRRYDFGGSYQFVIAGRYYASARVAISAQHHDHRFGEIGERDGHDVLLSEVAVRGTAGRHTWVAGAAAERDAYRPRDVRRFAYTYVAPGLFVQDDVQFAPWLSVSASARADFHNKYGAFVSPRLSMLARWNGWTTRFSAGQGFFAPTPLTEETEAAGLARLSVPQPLPAQKGRSASLDLTRKIGGASYTFTWFGSSVGHPLYAERGSRYELLSLPGRATNRGVELLAIWRKGPISMVGSYDYVRSREPEPGGVQAETPLTPRHSVGVDGMFERNGWRIGAEYYFTGRQRLEENPYRSESEPYFVFGLLIERKIRWARLFLNAENLNDVRQTRWNPLLRPARSADGRWTVDAWAPLEGRVINGGVRLRF